MKQNQLFAVVFDVVAFWILWLLYWLYFNMVNTFLSRLGRHKSSNHNNSRMRFWHCMENTGHRKAIPWLGSCCVFIWIWIQIKNRGRLWRFQGQSLSKCILLIYYLIDILEICFLLLFFMSRFHVGFVLVDKRSSWRHTKEY